MGNAERLYGWGLIIWVGFTTWVEHDYLFLGVSAISTISTISTISAVSIISAVSTILPFLLAPHSASCPMLIQYLHWPVATEKAPPAQGCNWCQPPPVQVELHQLIERKHHKCKVQTSGGKVQRLGPASVLVRQDAATTCNYIYTTTTTTYQIRTITA